MATDQSSTGRKTSPGADEKNHQIVELRGQVVTLDELAEALDAVQVRRGGRALASLSLSALADVVHERIAEARELLGIHDLDDADRDTLLRAAAHADAATRAIRQAIASLPACP